jgi:Sulfotransferase domain
MRDALRQPRDAMGRSRRENALAVKAKGARMSFVFPQDRIPASQAAPVTWLASFPRSGNTLLRLVLKSCFGLFSQSIYGDNEFPDAAMTQMVGEQAVGPDVQAFLRNARAQRRNLYVKTHELPDADHHPAITVVRDGRSALVSRWHYQRDMLGRSATLADIIAGTGCENWSAHARAWVGRRGTLVLRYEKLIAGDATTLARIADFLDRPQVAHFDISFARLHAINPSFFRSGSDAANIAQMDGAARALFDRLHGETLRALDY